MCAERTCWPTPGVCACRRSSACTAAELVEEIGAAQLVGDGDRVDGLALAVEGDDRVEDVRVRGLVEVGGVDVDLGRGADGVA